MALAGIARAANKRDEEITRGNGFNKGRARE